MRIYLKRFINFTYLVIFLNLISKFIFESLFKKYENIFFIVLLVCFIIVVTYEVYTFVNKWKQKNN